MAPRHELTDAAKRHRRTLYEDGRRPSKVAKDAMYEETNKMLGCEWYTKHNHSNWCTEEEKKIAAKLRGSHMMQWARERGYDVRKTLCAVGDEVHEPLASDITVSDRDVHIGDNRDSAGGGFKAGCCTKVPASEGRGLTEDYPTLRLPKYCLIRPANYPVPRAALTADDGALGRFRPSPPVILRLPHPKLSRRKMVGCQELAETFTFIGSYKGDAQHK
ncbi:hypothetical protein C8Q76DRAFT_689512 [Earliella scabrosa]|nr:hypothetical protein C8Q76DRAFT_689512 [Earliella scabrosa]